MENSDIKSSNNQITWIIVGVTVLFIALVIALFIIWDHSHEVIVSGVTPGPGNFNFVHVPSGVMMGITQGLDGLTFARVVPVPQGSPNRITFAADGDGTGLFTYTVINGGSRTNLVLGGIPSLNGITMGIFIGPKERFMGSGSTYIWDYTSSSQLTSAQVLNRVIVGTSTEISYQTIPPNPLAYTWRKIPVA